MTRPADVLAGRPGPGAVWWQTDLDAGYVGGIVRRAGGSFARLDVGAGVDAGVDVDVAAFHDAIAAVLGFPGYYGRNLDALNDCLGDLAGSNADGSAGVPVLWWEDWPDLAASEPRAFERIVGLLGDWLCLVLTVAPGAEA